MNFKEQYKAAFSEIHASEDIVERLCEVNDMKGNKMKINKSKKKLMALMAAAIVAVTSAVAVNAGALDEMVESIHMYINGEEVSASDYVNGDTIQLDEDSQISIEVDGFMVDAVGDAMDVESEVVVEIEDNGDGSCTARVTTTERVTTTDEDK